MPNHALTSENHQGPTAMRSQIPGQVMIFYSWTALSGPLTDTDQETPESSVAMGITDDRGRAMRAGEESLGSGQATVVIIEAVRPAMADRTLAPCYASTGVAWLGQRTSAGEVAWDRFFLRGDLGDLLAPGRMEP
jgi:hypothetical protein